MTYKYSDLENGIDQGRHLLNFDEETWTEIIKYLEAGRGDELLDDFKNKLKSEGFENSEESKNTMAEFLDSSTKNFKSLLKESIDNDSSEDQKLIDYLPESSREHEVFGKWLSLMYEREKGALPIDNNCINNVSGKQELDNEVASILLDTIQSHLPNYRWYDQDDNLRSVRDKKVIKQRKIQLFPLHLFTINWASSAPGIDWPESYSVTYVPSHNVRIVTASADSDEMWGYTDLAIGWCKPQRTPEFGVKKIIQTWWRNIHVSLGHPWADVYSTGLVDADRAEKWGLEVYGARSNYDDY